VGRGTLAVGPLSDVEKIARPAVRVCSLPCPAALARALPATATMPDIPTQERRQDHRIRYPLAERPSFLCDRNTYAVIDVSAHGLRYLASSGATPMPYTPISGILQFRRGHQAPIEAMVLRVQNNQVVLYLSKSEIPFSVLLDEQRYLHARYPMWS
jgi:hypothetical protein